MSIAELGRRLLELTKGRALPTSRAGGAAYRKYRPYHESFKVELPERTWPGKVMTCAPSWCSVDLRDGNQALVNPMRLDQKIEMWQLLLDLGFKEIEIGFPSASAVEYDFTRNLIDQDLIPEDVTPQVLVQARSHLIDKTFEALEGARRAVVHVYNSTSELQRRVVFKMEQREIIDLIEKAVAQIKELSASSGTEVVLEYSPESFTGTELEFALEICQAVMAVWQPTPEKRLILNLPATVEMSTPNIYADQIEWFCRHVKGRDSLIISVHPHNDRGTAVAAAELALLAGADRVEGTLFGNGERTGNVDLVTLALNLFSQGIDPGLHFDDLSRVRRIFERCTQIPVHVRHPYSGDLVFTAFSGSHQDAIRKGKQQMQKSGSEHWEVPYLPIDPADVGRTYEPIIRINSQSGKGGVAYIMETEYGYTLPKKMHPEFGSIIQRISDERGAEVQPQQIWEAFLSNYLEVERPYKFVKFSSEVLNGDGGGELKSEQVRGVLQLEIDGVVKSFAGVGNGPIDACKNALHAAGVRQFRLSDFVEHALSSGSDAEAAAYIQVETEDGRKFYGVGKDANTIKANIKALICAVNRAKL